MLTLAYKSAQGRRGGGRRRDPPGEGRPPTRGAPLSSVNNLGGNYR
jgi:hypothetical protein